jgi:hypothetical protein
MSDTHRHGNTPAAWTAVTVVFLGFLVAGIGVVAASPVLGVAGAVIVVAGGVVGKMMQLMGYGQKSYSS